MQAKINNVEVRSYCFCKIVFLCRSIKSASWLWLNVWASCYDMKHTCWFRPSNERRGTMHAIGRQFVQCNGRISRSVVFVGKVPEEKNNLQEWDFLRGGGTWIQIFAIATARPGSPALHGKMLGDINFEWATLVTLSLVSRSENNDVVSLDRNKLMSSATVACEELYNTNSVILFLFFTPQWPLQIVKPLTIPQKRSTAVLKLRKVKSAVCSCSQSNFGFLCLSLMMSSNQVSYEPGLVI